MVGKGKFSFNYEIQKDDWIKKTERNDLKDSLTKLKRKVEQIPLICDIYYKSDNLYLN